MTSHCNRRVRQFERCSKDLFNYKYEVIRRKIVYKTRKSYKQIQKKTSIHETNSLDYHNIFMKIKLQLWTI